MSVFLDFLGITIILPYLYLFARSLGASFFTYGALVAAYAAMQVMFAPIFGKLSDRYGRKSILILTLVGSAASYVLFGASNVLWLLSWLAGSLVSSVVHTF